ncbi:unnamed protein product, partial [Ectocarpus sp. 12 AP-2014]
MLTHMSCTSSGIVCEWLPETGGTFQGTPTTPASQAQYGHRGGLLRPTSPSTCSRHGPARRQNHQHRLRWRSFLQERCSCVVRPFPNPVALTDICAGGLAYP